METVPIGEVIRRRREEWGVSQEAVCEGLCTSMTLSRFENGVQTPSRDCVIAILQRLGLPDDGYFAQLTKDEINLISLRKTITAYSSMSVRVTKEQKEAFRIKAIKKINELDSLVKRDDSINRQFVVARSVYWKESNKHSEQDVIDILMDAIKLTVPKFDIEEIGGGLYSENEISIIISIASQYARSGRRRKAIDILGQLIKLLQKRYPNHVDLPVAAHNYAIYLGLERRYEESIDIAEIGKAEAIKQKRYLLLPGFLHIEAECRYFMGEHEESEKLYSSAYYLYRAVDDLENLMILEQEAKERLNLEFKHARTNN